MQTLCSDILRYIDGFLWNTRLDCVCKHGNLSTNLNAIKNNYGREYVYSKCKNIDVFHSIAGPRTRTMILFGSTDLFYENIHVYENLTSLYIRKSSAVTRLPELPRALQHFDCGDLPNVHCNSRISKFSEIYYHHDDADKFQIYHPHFSV
jgi:hypothetical protein